MLFMHSWDLKRLIEGMSDQCWNGYMAGEMKHVIGA